MNNSKKLLAIARICHRNFSQSASTSEALISKKIKLRQNQEKFQISDGTPVYIKGGAGDRILYFATLGLTALGLGMSLDVFYRITFK